MIPGGGEFASGISDRNVARGMVFGILGRRFPISTEVFRQKSFLLWFNNKVISRALAPQIVSVPRHVGIFVCGCVGGETLSLPTRVVACDHGVRSSHTSHSLRE